MLTCLVSPSDLEPLVLADEPIRGKDIIGRVGYDREPVAEAQVGLHEPSDPVRPSQSMDYRTSTGVLGHGVGNASKNVVTWVNPFRKHMRDNYNENEGPGKPNVIADRRVRTLDGRTQYPGQSRFRFNTNIPRPAYMSFSDLVDQEGVYT